MAKIYEEGKRAYHTGVACPYETILEITEWELGYEDEREEFLEALNEWYEWGAFE